VQGGRARERGRNEKERERRPSEHASRDARINSSASLRARNLEKHNLWTEMLVPVMAQRLEGPTASSAPDTATLPAQVIIAAALSCLDVAFAAWTATDGANSLGEILDLAFASVAG
jgi:hypothetical protein